MKGVSTVRVWKTRQEFGDCEVTGRTESRLLSRDKVLPLNPFVSFLLKMS